jgi:hypothetical protein
MRWTGHAARSGAVRNPYGSLIRKLNETKHLEKLGSYGWKYLSRPKRNSTCSELKWLCFGLWWTQKWNSALYFPLFINVWFNMQVYPVPSHITVTTLSPSHFYCRTLARPVFSLTFPTFIFRVYISLQPYQVPWVSRSSPSMSMYIFILFHCSFLLSLPFVIKHTGNCCNMLTPPPPPKRIERRKKKVLCELE